MIRRKKTLLLLLSVFTAAAGALWTFFIEPDRLVVREERIALPDWPHGLSGLRVTLISDLHVGAPFIDLEKLRRLVETVNAQRPDLVLMAGDFVIQDVVGGRFVAPEDFAAELGKLKARHGVYAVLGNHDWWLDGERVRRALESAGVRVLENEAARVEVNGSGLWVAGLSDLWTRRPDVAGTLGQVSDAGAVIALTHNPDLFIQLPPRVSLTVAGHTHGGQVNLPLLGRLVVPSDYKQRFAAGHVVEQGRHLFVTTGVGTSIIPARFRVPPEIVVLTLTGDG